MNLPGYDEWKTTPPEGPKPKAYCSYCDKDLYEGDAIYDINGEYLCEDCLDDEFRRIL